MVFRLFTLAALTVRADLGANAGQVRGTVPAGPFLWEKLPEVPHIFKMGRRTAAITTQGAELRHPDNCVFPLDVVIVQDATQSFADNIDAMRDTQVDLIYQGITKSHPNTRFGVVSFRDKPIFPLGDPDSDYCTKIDQPLTTNLADVKLAFKGLTAYGGADAPENQFGALYNVLNNNAIGWAAPGTTASSKLIIISTDAGPHFAGDSSSGLLPPMQTSNDDDIAVCKSQYYPAPEVVKSAIQNRGVYVASLVYDGDWANGWAAKSWKDFNEYIGQSDAFVAPQAPDSSDFWDKLAKIVTEIETIECGTPTPAPTTTVVVPATDTTTTATTTTPTPTITALPTTTAATPVVTTAGTPELPSTTVGPTVTVINVTQTTKYVSTPADADCKCPCENCTCCPEMVIEFRHKPKEVHLDVKNG